MCVFVGHRVAAIHQISEEEAIVGWRNNVVSERGIESVHLLMVWDERDGLPFMESKNGYGSSRRRVKPAVDAVVGERFGVPKHGGGVYAYKSWHRPAALYRPRVRVLLWGRVVEFEPTQFASAGFMAEFAKITEIWLSEQDIRFYARRLRRIYPNIKISTRKPRNLR